MTDATKVYFTITGEFMTDHARDMVLEGNWAGAITLLHESLEGISYDEIFQVLQGTHRLIDRNDLDIEEDPDSAEYLERLESMYLGLVRVGQKYYQPYAEVTNYGIQDLRDEVSNVSCSRARHYMDDLRHDLAREQGGRAILWRLVPPPPSWMSIDTEQWDTALEAMMERCTLDSRGHEQCYRGGFWGGPTPEERDDALTEVEARAERILIHKELEVEVPDDIDTQLIELTAAKTGISFEAVAETQKAIKGEQDLDSIPEPAAPDTPNGWVTVDGKFYACAFHEHGPLAVRLLKLHKLEIADDPEKQVEGMGWLRLSQSALDETVLHAQVQGKLTPKQRKTYLRWCNSNDFRPSLLVEDIHGSYDTETIL